MNDLLAPKDTPDLFGHGHAEDTLLESYHSGKLHHAWLLSGPRGIGKATLAYRFARFLLKHGKPGADDQGGGLFGEAVATQEPDSLYVDPDDPVFHRISAGAHGDLKVIEREFDEKKNRFKGVIGVDRVRGVGGFLSKTSAEGGWRIVIIDAADEMNRNSANAILKVLEEPPKNAILLLLAHNPGRLLPTIRSRCRTLTLKALEEETLITMLKTLDADQSEEECAMLAKLSEGSFGRAVHLYEEGGLSLYEELLNILNGLPRLNVEKLHQLGEKMARSGADESFRTLGDLLIWWLGRLISQSARAKTSGMGLSPDDDQLMVRVFQSCDLDVLMTLWRDITRMFQQAQSGDLDRKQVVLNAFLALEGAVRR